MKVHKPILEKIEPSFGHSFKIIQHAPLASSTKSPHWHFHPELELVYVKGGSGKRHIGHHLSYFHHGDLILIGSNLPHLGFTDHLTGNETEIVVQFESNFLGTGFFDLPEMAEIKRLFTRAKSGIVFRGATKKNLGIRLEQLVQSNAFTRLQELLAILQQLAQSTDYQLLNASEVALEVTSQDNKRINDVYQFVRSHFQRNISLEEISQVTNMSEPAFCRYFKKLSGKTFTQFVNEFRVVHACKLLAEQPLSITAISLESGFSNFSHFSKQFRAVTGKSPSEYRKELKQVVQ